MDPVDELRREPIRVRLEPLVHRRQRLGIGRVGHRVLVLRARLGDVERRRQVEDRLAVLDRDHTPRREAAAVADAVDVVDDRHPRVARPQEVGVQRVHVAVVDGPSRRDQRLPRDLPAEHPLREAEQRVWFRADGKLPDDPLLHDCIVAYASDLTLLDTAVMAHARSWDDDRFMIASLDHAMWFHRPVRADEWLLYHQRSPSAQAGRGLAEGFIYRRDGTLAVTVMQEGLIRPVKPGWEVL